jgi:hypothetical protein
VDAERGFAGVKGAACGDVQQPVAQALGLAARELEVAERQIPEAGVLVVAAVRLGVCALALAALEHLDVGVGLVG